MIDEKILKKLEIDIAEISSAATAVSSELSVGLSNKEMYQQSLREMAFTACQKIDQMNENVSEIVILLGIIATKIEEKFSD